MPTVAHKIAHKRNRPLSQYVAIYCPSLTFQRLIVVRLVTMETFSVYMSFTLFGTTRHDYD